MRDQETTEDAWAASQSSPYRIGSPEREAEGCVCTHDMRRGPRDPYSIPVALVIEYVWSARLQSTVHRCQSSHRAARARTRAYFTPYRVS